MMLKTHFAISLFFIILFFPIVNSKIIFTVVCLFATILPDMDSRFSKIGKRFIVRILNFFSKHRGFFHSYTFLLLITLIFTLYLPVVAFGFFLGYGLHLFGDSFTHYGIVAFWPSKRVVSGSLKTGGKIEKSLLVVIIVGVFMLFAWRTSII
jgi:membrane-bound metal-dependent hydrolase YbcI (DUF457 family)